MKGNVYTREKCPVCGENFRRVGKSLICPEHQTKPHSFYIQVWSKQLHKAVNVPRDSRLEKFHSYEDADLLLSTMRQEVKVNGDFDPSRYVTEHLRPLLFTNWSKTWLERKTKETEKGLKSPAYLKAIRVYVRKFQTFFKDIDIREVGTKTVNDFYLSLNGAPHYIKNILDALKKILQDAFDWEDIKILPKFPKVDVPEAETKTIDLDDQDKIVNAIPDQMDRAFILFTAREMIRPSETRALQWEDINLKHDRVIIRRHFSLNQIRPATKAKQIKILPLDGEVKKTIQGLPRHLASPFVFWKGKMGRPFSESWARKLWKRTARQFGVEISLYQGTRHSSATEAVNRVGVDSVQEFLGHTSRAMTKRYAKINVESKIPVLRKMKP